MKHSCSQAEADSHPCHLPETMPLVGGDSLFSIDRFSAEHTFTYAAPIRRSSILMAATALGPR